MQARSVVLGALLCLLLSSTAGADSITSVTPDTVPFGSTESFINIQGDGLLGTESTLIAYDSGESVEPSGGNEFSLIAYVPVSVTFAAGPHTFEIFATDIGGTVRRIGPATVNVGTGTNEPGPPQLTLPELVIAEAEDASGAHVSYEASATSFDGQPVDVVCSPPSGSLFALGSTNVHCTATDANGTSSGDFSVFVTDSTPPVLILPADIESAVAEVNYTATATDALDGDVPVDCSPASGSAFPAGPTTVNCVAHDAHFNYVFGSFRVTVTNGPPALTVPDDYTVEATGPTGALVNYDVSATGGATITCTPPSGSILPFGNNQVDCTATNSFGSDSDTFFVFVIDTFAPTMTLPSPTVAATSPSGAVVNYTATATDIVDGSVPVTCDPPSGSLFPIGATVVNCTASDSLGNAASGQFTVTVTNPDHTPPVLTVSNLTRQATSAAGAVVTFAPTAVDNVDGSVPVVCTPPSGSTFALGTTQVHCTATDSAGNVGSANFNVTVVDTTGPVLNIANVTAEATSLLGAIVNYSASATDAVSGNVPISCTPHSGTLFLMGQTTVNCTAVDARNNRTNGSFIVRVVDTTPPNITLVLPAPSFLWPALGQMVPVAVVIVANDSVDLFPTSRIFSVTANQPLDPPGSAHPDYRILGPNLVELRAERTNNQPRTYTITVESIDDAGNRSTRTVDIDVAAPRRRPN
jgi:HYR domain-containing protein